MLDIVTTLLPVLGRASLFLAVAFCVAWGLLVVTRCRSWLPHRVAWAAVIAVGVLSLLPVSRTWELAVLPTKPEPRERAVTETTEPDLITIDVELTTPPDAAISDNRHPHTSGDPDEEFSSPFAPFPLIPIEDDAKMVNAESPDSRLHGNDEQEEAAVIVQNPVEETPEAKSSLLSALLPALSALWMTGVLFLVLRFLFRTLRFHRFLRKNILTNEIEADWFDDWRRLQLGEGVKRPIPLIVAEDFGPALTWRPGGFALIVPLEGWDRLSAEERESVMRHELAHYVRGDVWKSFFARLLSLPHWFNPLSRAALRRYEDAAEWACDEAALGERGEAVSTFARALVSLHETSLQRPQIALPEGALQHNIFGRNISSRVARLLTFHPLMNKDSIMKKLFLLAACAVLVSAAFVQIRLVAQNPPDNGQHAHEQLNNEPRLHEPGTASPDSPIDAAPEKPETQSPARVNEARVNEARGDAARLNAARDAENLKLLEKRIEIAKEKADRVAAMYAIGAPGGRAHLHHEAQMQYASLQAELFLATDQEENAVKALRRKAVHARARHRSLEAGFKAGTVVRDYVLQAEYEADEAITQLNKHDPAGLEKMDEKTLLEIEREDIQSARDNATRRSTPRKDEARDELDVYLKGQAEIVASKNNFMAGTTTDGNVTLDTLINAQIWLLRQEYKLRASYPELEIKPLEPVFSGNLLGADKRLQEFDPAYREWLARRLNAAAEACRRNLESSLKQYSTAKDALADLEIYHYLDAVFELYEILGDSKAMLEVLRNQMKLIETLQEKAIVAEKPYFQQLRHRNVDIHSSLKDNTVRLTHTTPKGMQSVLVHTKRSLDELKRDMIAAHMAFLATEVKFLDGAAGGRAFDREKARLKWLDARIDYLFFNVDLTALRIAMKQRRESAENFVNAAQAGVQVGMDPETAVLDAEAILARSGFVTDSLVIMDIAALSRGRVTPDDGTLYVACLVKSPLKPETQSPARGDEARVNETRVNEARVNEARQTERELTFQGKSFDVWVRELETELDPKQRGEAFRALATFGANGRGKEAAEVIVAAVKSYNFNRTGRPDDPIAAMKISAVQAFVTPDIAIPTEDSLPILLRQLQNGNENEFSFAVKALLGFHDGNFQDKVYEILWDDAFDRWNAERRRLLFDLLRGWYNTEGVLKFLREAIEKNDPARFELMFTHFQPEKEAVTIPYGGGTAGTYSGLFPPVYRLGQPDKWDRTPVEAKMHLTDFGKDLLKLLQESGMESENETIRETSRKVVDALLKNDE